MSCSYSHRRQRSKGDITAPTERVCQNPVTGEIERTALDGVQLAFEGVRRAFDAAALRLTAPELERLADMLVLMAAAAKRHRDRDLDRLREVLRAMGGCG